MIKMKPGAFERIEKACRNRIEEIYPYGIPELAEQRLNRELCLLQKSDYVDDMEIFRELTIEARRCCQFFTMRGTITGSYLIYLLGDNRFNPLPAHYYCKECGHFETVQTKLFGLDLPDNKCPNCGAVMKGDGFNLTAESVWGFEGKKSVAFEYNISADFQLFAKAVIKKIYPNNPVITKGIMVLQDNEKYEASGCEVVPGGFVVLQEGKCMEDYPELITYLEDGEKCLSGNFYMQDKSTMKTITLIHNRYMDWLLELQRKQGYYIQDISMEMLKEITVYDLINSRCLSSYSERMYEKYKPKTMRRIIGFESFFHGTYTADIEPNNMETAGEWLMETEQFKKKPCYFGEDYYDYMLEEGKEAKEAFDIVELIRKGKLSREKKFGEYALSPELEFLAQHTLYCFSKAHAIEYVLIYMRLAYYMKRDSKTYSRIVFSENKKSIGGEKI